MKKRDPPGLQTAPFAERECTSARGPGRRSGDALVHEVTDRVRRYRSVALENVPDRMADDIVVDAYASHTRMAGHRPGKLKFGVMLRRGQLA
jgi:hypothetical protein